MPLGSCALSASLESQSMASAAAASGYLMADFNSFLLQIASEIKSYELVDMKFLCEGDSCLRFFSTDNLAGSRSFFPDHVVPDYVARIHCCRHLPLC